MLLIKRPPRQYRCRRTRPRKLNAARIPYYRRHIGVVFQDHQLLSDRSVFDNVALPLQIAGYAPKDIGRRVRAALDKVALLDKEKIFQ